MSHLKICGVNKSDVALRSLALLSSSSAFGSNVLSLLLLPFHGKTSGFCLHFWLEPRLSRVLGGNTVENHAVSHVREEGVELCVSFNPPSCQNFFNDCRDSEKRQARHANRSNMNLQALHIGSARARYNKLRHIEISDQDVSELSDEISVKSSCFQCEQAGSLDYLSFNSNDIVAARTSWASTKPDKLESNQCLLMKVLLNVDSSQWANLWVCSLYRQHMIVTD